MEDEEVEEGGTLGGTASLGEREMCRLLCELVLL